MFASFHLSAVDNDQHLFPRHHHLNILTCSSGLTSTTLLVLGLSNTRGQYYHKSDAQSVPIIIKTDLAAEEVRLSFANAGSVQHSAYPAKSWNRPFSGLVYQICFATSRCGLLQPLVVNSPAMHVQHVLGTNYVHLAMLCHSGLSLLTSWPEVLRQTTAAARNVRTGIIAWCGREHLGISRHRVGCTCI